MKDFNTYNVIHKAFKEIVDSKLGLDDQFKEVDIDLLWSISKATNNGKVAYLLNLSKSDLISDSIQQELRDAFQESLTQNGI
ncbi:hypothetical protein BKP44_06780 [Formosa algae]|nr:hypothetical protein BKP44_06780 [Formosa algae]